MIMETKIVLRNFAIETRLQDSEDTSILTHIFHITNLMHNSFIFQQYVCYTTMLNMF